MSLYHAAASLIQNIEPEAVLLAVGGLVLITASFMHGFYLVFSATGTLFLAAAAGIRISGGGGIEEIFVMFFLTLSLITLSYFIVMRSAKYGWIIRGTQKTVQQKSTSAKD